MLKKLFIKEYINIIEQIFSSSKYRQMRRKLEASTVNDNVKWLVNQYINKRFNFKSNVLVRLAKTENPYADFQTMLDMIYYHHLGEHMIKLIPYNSDFLSLPEQNFARLSYEFLQSKTHLNSNPSELLCHQEQEDFRGKPPVARDRSRD